MEQFFCVTHPGFEKDIISEIKNCEQYILNSDLSRDGQIAEKSKFNEYKILNGGVEFEADIFHAVQLNFFLKGCTRILWRLDTFKAKDFLTLKEKLNRTKLKSMSKNHQLKYKISSTKSRIYNESKIKDICEEVFIAPKVSTDEKSNIYVNIHVSENTFQISLDISEAPLYQRGWAPLKETAPLRENWVARMFKDSSFYKNFLATPNAIFIDPCAGSGTLGWELLLMQFPQLQRTFAFQNYPGVPKLFKMNFAPNYNIDIELPTQNFYLFDNDKKCVETSSKNLASIQDVLNGAKFKHSKPFTTALKNQFTIKSLNALDRSQWIESSVPKKTPLYIASNLPYGERLQEFDFEKLLNNLVHLKSAGWNLKRSAFYVSATQYQRIKRSLNSPDFECIREVPFTNGGLPCIFFELDWE